jgi:dGTP triphosphohydrolase
MTESAHKTIEQLFTTFMGDLDRMPLKHNERARTAAVSEGSAGSARRVADYIAGMTDRFALQSVEQLEA